MMTYNECLLFILEAGLKIEFDSSPYIVIWDRSEFGEPCHLSNGRY